LYACLSLLLTACASAPALQTGPDAEVTFDGLTRVDNTVMDAAWVRRDLDLSRYRGLMLEGVEIEFRPTTRSGGPAGNVFPVSQDQRDRLRQVVGEAFRSALSQSDRFELVSAPGPDVLLIRGSLLDVVSNVPPATAGRTDIYLSQVGEATLVLELYDATTDAILARAVDRRAAGDISGRLTQAGTVTTWSEVRRVANLWATQLRKGLESLAEAAESSTR